MRTYYATIGLPASGKSTWAHGMMVKNPDKTTSISSDNIREFLYGSRSIQGNPWGVFKEILKVRIEEDWENIILDVTNAKRKDRINQNNLIKTFETREDFRIIGVYFDTPYDVCIKRNESRDESSRVPTVHIRRYRDALSANIPGRGEGYDEVWKHSEIHHHL